MFLTGGSGLVGSHVAEQLRAAGSAVRALQRPGSDTRHLTDRGCEVVYGDVTDAVEVHRKAMLGCDAVVHAAAAVYAKGSWARTEAVNVYGTRSILVAASRAGVDHAVHLSSVAVYGSRPGPLDEETPTDGELRPADVYARSKRAAEQVVDEVRRSEGLCVTVVRPAVVFGERDRLFTPRLARLATLPIIPLLGSGHHQVPVVYAGNLASAVLRSLSVASDNTFVLGADTAASQRDLVVAMARALGRRPRVLPLPPALARTAARAADGLRLGPPGAEGLSLVRAVRLWTGENPYRTGRILKALDWSPPYGLDAAMRRTAAWLVGRFALAREPTDA